MSSYLFHIVQSHEPWLWAVFLASCFVLLALAIVAAIPTPSAQQIVELIERERSPFADRELDR